MRRSAICELHPRPRAKYMQPLINEFLVLFRIPALAESSIGQLAVKSRNPWVTSGAWYHAEGARDGGAEGNRSNRRRLWDGGVDAPDLYFLQRVTKEKRRNRKQLNKQKAALFYCGSGIVEMGVLCCDERSTLRTGPGFGKSETRFPFAGLYSPLWWLLHM